MNNLLKSHGTIPHKFCPHTHQQNRVAKRKRRHLLEVTEALLLSVSVPKCYWPEAVLTVVLLINIAPSSVNIDVFVFLSIWTLL